MPQQCDAEFTAFVTARYERLRRTAQLLTLDQALADDLLQLTLIRTYVKWTLVSAAADADAYVRRVMINENIAMARRSRRQRAGRFAEGSSSESPADVAEARDEALRLLRILPMRQRTALALRYLEDLNDAEIADALGCRRSTVRSLVKRGLDAIRKYETVNNERMEVQGGVNRTACS